MPMMGVWVVEGREGYIWAIMMVEGREEEVVGGGWWKDETCHGV